MLLLHTLLLLAGCGAVAATGSQDNCDPTLLVMCPDTSQAQACFACVGEHQHELRVAGCSPQELQQWCDPRGGGGNVGAAPVKLLIDTDAGFDVDDVGAVCLANALADNGEAEIVAVGHTNGYNKGIGSVSTLMHFYGRDAVPLGAYKGAWAENPRAPGAKGTADKYIPDLVNGFPSPVKDYSTVPTAVQAYRQVLAAQPDHSVHIAAIGITTNMRDLVQSQPDSFSPLNGHDLIAKKVKVIVWMDMMYNFGCAQHDTDNWLGSDEGCRGSAQVGELTTKRTHARTHARTHDSHCV
eukprot:COSAG01_NODE_8768_length_2665_cov_25.306703_2_plen_296_part_00